MLLRSYTGDVDGNVDALRWVLFVRQEEQDSKDTFLVFTAAVTISLRNKEEDTSPRNVVAELRVDSTTLEKHIEELGVEENVTTFQNLMLKTLEERKSVNVVVENEQETSGKPLEVLLELMYKFNASILRKGVFQLSVVATDAPQSVVDLLESIHNSPPQPVVSKEQQIQRAGKRTLSGVTKGAKTAGSQDESGTAPAAVNPSMLKRRHIPTGTMRRKGPRGAKLSKS